jgi:hypothetical protein
MIPVKKPSFSVYELHPIPIPIKGDAQVQIQLHHKAGQGFGMRGTAGLVDVPAIRGVEEGHHLGSRPLEEPGSQAVGGPVG